MENLLNSNIALFVFLAITIYILFNISVILGWFRLPKIKLETKSSRFNTFSILIPMRNESGNIEKLLNDIVSQNYPKEQFEIIVIDDHSEDKSLELVQSLNIPNLRIIRGEGEGKKLALITGFQLANNKYIIQTDADCRMEKDWLTSINQYLNQHTVKLLMAPVVFETEANLLAHLQELDFYALMMSTAGLTGLKHPIMANGANLIYLKEIVQGIDVLNNKSASGDDVFLLHYVKKEFGAKAIHYLNSKEATVRTQSARNVKSFINQRIRWASKSKYYKDIDTISIGALIFFVNLILVLLLLGSLFSDLLSEVFIIAFISKMVVDYLLLMTILQFYKRVELLIYFPILSFLYLFYVSFVGIISQFVSFKWKGRKY